MCISISGVFYTGLYSLSGGLFSTVFFGNDHYLTIHTLMISAYTFSGELILQFSGRIFAFSPLRHNSGGLILQSSGRVFAFSVLQNFLSAS